MQPDHFSADGTLGLYVLFNSLKEQPHCFGENRYQGEYSDCGLYVATDLLYVFTALRRLRKSLERNDRLETAVDATSFFLFTRILYDSLGGLIHVLYKILNPTDSRRWPARQSFREMLKSLRSNPDPYFDEFKRVLSAYDFETSFSAMRDIRNGLKEIAGRQGTRRLMWTSAADFPMTGNLRNEVGRYLLSVLSFMDFLDDYFLMKIEEKTPIHRLEVDHHGSRRGYLTADEIETYRWFNTATSV
jgi:hypothetical protein